MNLRSLKYWTKALALLGGIVVHTANAQPPPAKPEAPPAASAPADGKADREIYFDIGHAGARKIRLAIPSFGLGDKPSSSVSAADRDTYAARLSDLLAFTNAFEVIPASGFLAKNDPASKAINYEEWTPINTELLIMAKFEAAPEGKVAIEFRLYDVKKKKMLLGKRYRPEKTQVDYVLRRFADLVMEVLTGEMGMFTSKIAFVGAKVAGQPRQVYISNFDGTELQQITDNGSINMSPSWSPDGTKLTFTSFKDGKAEIYVFNLLTRKLGRLTRSKGNNSGANWHPNGRTLAFAGGSNGLTAIYTMNSTSGSERSPLITGSGLEVEPAYSPDGTKLAFVSGRFTRPHVFIRDLASSQDTRITFAGWYNSSPAWRPDNKKIAFAGYDKEIDRYDVFIVNPDGRQLERLTLDQGDNEKPSWSPDGRFLIYQSNRVGSGRGKTRAYKLYTMSKDGADQKPLNIPLAEVQMPTWGPRQMDIEN